MAAVVHLPLLCRECSLNEEGNTHLQSAVIRASIAALIIIQHHHLLCVRVQGSKRGLMQGGKNWEKQLKGRQGRAKKCLEEQGIEVCSEIGEQSRERSIWPGRSRATEQVTYHRHSLHSGSITNSPIHRHIQWARETRSAHHPRAHIEACVL
jgi:hypothetical protein